MEERSTFENASSAEVRPGSRAASSAETRSDGLCRFYTSAVVGGLLVEMMGARTPRRILDIGAGGGSLSRAASQRWAQADLVTVDLDDACEGTLRHVLAGPGRQHVHHVHDALDPRLPALVGMSGVVDAAICNPPYRRPVWRPGYEQVLWEAGLDGAFTTTADVTAEVLFLAQNVRIVGEGGRIGLIVPDGLVTGSRTREFRRALLRRHKVDAVVQLPAASFKHASIQAFIVVFRNRAGESGSVNLTRYDAATGLCAPIEVDHDAAVHRMDYANHAVAASTSGLATLAELGAEVRRGTVNATRARAEHVAVLHTSDLNVAGDGRLNLRVAREGADRADAVVAEAGDIVMARIDRNLHRKIAMVVDGRRMISDCVYRVRVPDDLVVPVLEALRSDEGARRIEAATRGVAARHISKGELLSLPLIPRGLLR